MEMVWIHIIFIREMKIPSRFAGEGCVSTKYPYGLAHVSPCPRSDELCIDIRRQQCAHMDQCSHDEHGELFVARGIDDFYDNPCGQ